MKITSSTKYPTIPSVTGNIHHYFADQKKNERTSSETIVCFSMNEAPWQVLKEWRRQFGAPVQQAQALAKGLITSTIDSRSGFNASLETLRFQHFVNPAAEHLRLRCGGVKRRAAHLAEKHRSVGGCPWFPQLSSFDSAMLTPHFHPLSHLHPSLVKIYFTARTELTQGRLFLFSYVSHTYRFGM